MIDIGDTVLHRPTGEKWLVAAVSSGYVYYCGYPFGGYGQIEDCVFVNKATKKERIDLIKEICSGKGGTERAIILARKVAEREGIDWKAEKA
jgi:hypothetical protein